MIGYVTLGTNNFPRATKFYDALLAELDAKRFMDFDGFVTWGTERGKPAFALAKPYDKKPATVGNGVMVALQAASKQQVDAIYDKALALGGTDEGKPGQRTAKFYAAYFRDLDGNKLNAFFIG